MPCDYSKYPKNWKLIRNEILERAQNRCECAGECGAELSRILPSGTILIGDHQHEALPVEINLNPGATWDDNSLKYRCIETHLNKPKTFGGRRVILTIAHTNPSRNTRCVQRNKLKAMCQACHLRFDRKNKSKKEATNENLHAV